MANAAAIMTSFKVELLNGIHAFGTTVVRGGTGADTFKCALIGLGGSIGATTTVWASSGISEVTSSGYTNGGLAFTWVAPASANAKSYSTPSASISWTTVTFTTDCALLYNSTQSNKAIASYALGTIGVGQSVSAGNFTLTMPTNDDATGLLRIA